MSESEKRAGRAEEKRKLRTEGLCPYDERKCDMAHECALSKMQSCARLVENLTPCCSKCRQEHGFECVGWRCFREHERKEREEMNRHRRF